MYFSVDPQFREHFRHLQQVFLYITDECNLRCVHCIYKPNITFHLGQKEFELETALALISDFREMGASKLSILGGEPTLYGVSQDWQPLLALISKAKEFGYEYVRMDTNGTFNSAFLLHKELRDLDEISFSLDGPTPEINDAIRGKGVFNKCVSNIKKAKELGFHVNITCTVHRDLIKRDKNGRLLIESMIQLAASLKVDQINFHVLFDRGTPEDVWTTSEIHVLPEEWVDIYAEISRNIDSGKYEIPVRIPQSFVTREEFEKDPEYYGFCPVKLGERVLVHPNGIIRICSSLLSTPYCIGYFYDNKIVWNKGRTNELRDHKLDQFTPCTNQSKKYHSGKLVPLCFSLKPRQKEFVWQQKIKWEKRRSLSEED